MHGHVTAPSNAQPKAARSPLWKAMVDWATMKKVRYLLEMGPDTVRPSFLPRRSYVAPGSQRSSLAKRSEVELNSCSL